MWAVAAVGDVVVGVDELDVSLVDVYVWCGYDAVASDDVVYGSDSCA